MDEAAWFGPATQLVVMAMNDFVAECFKPKS
jgi:hypothetical protein